MVPAIILKENEYTKGLEGKKNWKEKEAKDFIDYCEKNEVIMKTEKCTYVNEKVAIILQKFKIWSKFIITVKPEYYFNKDMRIAKEKAKREEETVKGASRGSN